VTAKSDSVGFGVPNTVDPHYFAVIVPRGRDESVVLTERFGIAAESKRMPDALDRVVLDRAKWTTIADPVRRAFNERLTEKNLAASRWSVGENKVERLLGKELCVLAWAIEKAPLALVSAAVTNWAGLRPEERWWLFTVTAAATGGVDDGDTGWRKALRFALTENPVEEQHSLFPREGKRVRAARHSADDIPLFGRLAEEE